MVDRIKVLVVDDHVVLAEGIRSLLEGNAEVEVCGMAHSGTETLEQLIALDPDVVLLDINLPDMDGLEVMSEIKERGDRVAVLALSMHEEEAFITGMIERGAKGYLLKSTDEDELLEAVKTVHAGNPFYSSKVTQTLMDGIIQRQRSATPKAQGPSPISDREKQVLQLIVQEYTTDEIAEALHISRNTVETHRRHLLEKLGARNAAGLVRIAIERDLFG